MIKKEFAVYAKKCSMFSSKSFIISGLMFRSLIILSLFLCMVLESVIFHFYTCSCPVFPAPFIEEALFSPLYIFPLNICPCLFLFLFCFVLFCFLRATPAAYGGSQARG